MIIQLPNYSIIDTADIKRIIFLKKNDKYPDRISIIFKDEGFNQVQFESEAEAHEFIDDIYLKIVGVK